MTKYLLLLFSIIPIFAFSQKTKRVTDKIQNEEYFVLKSDNNVKHGLYKKSKFIKGYYKNGTKDSIWEFYNSKGSVVRKYDYSNGLLLFNDTSDIQSGKYRVINRFDTIELILSKPPLFLASSDYVFEILSRNIQYPPIARENGIEGKIWVSFIIDQNGITSNFKTKETNAFGLDIESIRVLKFLSDYWIPGKLNGESIEVEYSYPISYRLN